MTSPLDRIRAVALQLPGVEERVTEGRSVFLVAGVEFATVGDAEVRVLPGNEQAGSSDDGASDLVSISLTGDVDWTLIEDRVAHSWELTAPRDLLEAGGR